MNSILLFPLLTSISIGGLVPLLINIIVAGLILWLLWWLISYVGLPEPFAKVARVILAVVAVVWIINLLLGLTGNAFIR